MGDSKCGITSLLARVPAWCYWVLNSFKRVHSTNLSSRMKPPRSKLRGITRKGIVCETPRFLTLFPLQGNLEASSEESPDSIMLPFHKNFPLLLQLAF